MTTDQGCMDENYVGKETLQQTLRVRGSERKMGHPFAARAERCEPVAPGGQCGQRRVPGVPHSPPTPPSPQFLAPSPWVLFPAQQRHLGRSGKGLTSWCWEVWLAGAPVDEAGLAHVEVADDNHLGEVEPVRHVVVLLSVTVTRASSHTQALPSLRSPPDDGTGYLLKHWDV